MTNKKEIKVKGCTVCGKPKNKEHFWECKASRDGMQSRCIECSKARYRTKEYKDIMKKIIEKNREERRIKAKERREKNKDRVNAYQKARREKKKKANDN